MLPFALHNRVLTGQVQANIAYTKLKDFKNGFVLPTGRKSEYINHYYGTSINVMPSKRLNVFISGNFYPSQRYTTYSGEWNTSWDVDVNYSFLRKRNLILRLCASNLFAKDSRNTSYFLDNRYHSTSQSKGPELLLSLKFKFGKGQKVVEEYKDYSPNVGRLQD